MGEGITIALQRGSDSADLIQTGGFPVCATVTGDQFVENLGIWEWRVRNSRGTKAILPSIALISKGFAALAGQVFAFGAREVHD
ncbi:hypothetical protein [Sinisalibacter aestuarii]|uniref:hypothetical protein n=1 Tax=Sinisalibacter aestuarii TaxID=2949426 RepID=UPI002491FC80|nr:hypothetical protein [Sinisalibacter aestuarii]